MPFNKHFTIGSQKVGIGKPAMIIAEIGRNHNGDLEMGKEMINAAASAGADVAKFQSFRAENLLIKELPKVSHIKETSDANKSAYDSTQEVELTEEMHQALRDHANSKGIMFMSTPEDHSMISLLNNLGVPAYKIASLDIVYLDLVEAIAQTGKPIIMSTGMSYLGEIEKALNILEKQGIKNVILLQCTSNYPTRPENVNLMAMKTLSQCFDIPVGLSDHTEGISISIASAALGACLVERHFTIDKNLPGPDHRLSLVPEEFTTMVKGIRDVEAALGSPVKRPVESEIEMRRLHRRRLVASHHIQAGRIITREDIGCKCSAEGLEPEMLQNLIGRKLVSSMNLDDPFKLESVISIGK